MNDIIKENMQVTKRGGHREAIDLDKIHRVVTWACEGVPDVSVSQVELKAAIQFFDGITSHDIQEMLIKSAADLISDDPEVNGSPNYETVAGRLLMFHMRKIAYGQYTPPHLLEHVKNMTEKGVYSSEILEKYSGSEINQMNDWLDHDKDLEFTYVAMSQFRGKYLAQDRVTKRIYESPQVLYMLVSATFFIDIADKEKRMNYIHRFYKLLSEQKISLPTPIMGGMRTPIKQFSSCVLIEVDDTLNSIVASTSAIVKYIAKKAGIGVNVGRIRAVDSPVAGNTVNHTGVIPFIKLFQAAVKSSSQGGIRGGSATAYYPIWHLEIEDLLVLKNNKGIEDNRARHLDYGVSVNGLFYKRLIENKNITLFSPHDVPDMYEAFFSDPKEFARLYEQYEADNTIRKKSIPALEIFSKLLQERANTGRIYIFNADHTNTHSAFDASVAPVKQSNLCCLPGDAIIPVSEEDGLFKSIKELAESGKEVKVLNSINNSHDPATMTVMSSAIAYSQGIKRVFRLVLSNGDYIRCTEDHKLATIEGEWVEAKDSLNKRIVNFSPNIETIDCCNTEIFVKEIIEESEEEVFDITITEEGALPQFYTFFGESEYAYLVHNCEITLPTKPLQSLEDPNGEIALCTLAAVNLGKLESLDDLEEIMEMLVLALDLLLDYQDYPVAAAYHSTMARRMLGIGVINYAYYLAKNHVMYSDGSANTLTHELFEAIQYYGLKASVKLAKERGKCPKFNETMYAKGMLPIDTYRKKLDNYVEPNYKLDWETLRKEIQEYGLRNSTITAIAPTETSAQISNATNGIEPPRSYISIKQSKHGILPQVVPEYETLKPYYELAWQMPSNKGYLTLVGIMQKFIDQAISANTYYDPAAFGGKTPMTVLINDLLFTYDLGIKTLYYHNTRDGSGETVKNPEESEDCDSCKI